MIISKISLFAAVLVLATTVAASAAVTVRTPAAGNLAAGGFGYCAAVNGGTKPATVTTTMFSLTVGSGERTDSVTVPAKQVRFGTKVPTTGDATGPAWCECIVPDKAKVRCSFIAVNGRPEHVTVLPAE